MEVPEEDDEKFDKFDEGDPYFHVETVSLSQNKPKQKISAPTISRWFVILCKIYNYLG
jgi:hypothetical protein